MTQQNEDFLVEIGTEELPPKSLYRLGTSFAENIEQELSKLQLSFDQIQFYATPRRLAVLVKGLNGHQGDRVLEKIGPNMASAYDSQGQPTPAAIGFAKSCQVDISDLKTKETPKGNCLYFSQKVSGKSIFELAPDFVKNALNQLPIPKPMVWGNHSTAFIRPVQWLVMLYGTKIIPCELFELSTGNQTFGHRFHHPGTITVNKPAEFESLLQTEGFVVSNYQERKENIRNQIITVGKSKGKPIIDEELLDEVTGLVEWPVAFLGSFDSRFLKVPQEALISAMKLHQKSFPVVNNDGELLPYFIAIANIVSKDPAKVIAGNERVMHARLADAEFFYHADLKQGIEHYLEQLKGIIFQNKLGTVYEKATRISKLSSFLASLLSADVNLAKQAGLLCKADLTTDMVSEFPELQGVMGFYYAIEDKKPKEVAVAIKEHYQPRFAGDGVPSSSLGSIVALADKIDTLVGIFGINQAPTGEKDPFALRRAAVGALRILIENQLPLDLKEMITQAASLYLKLENPHVVEDTLSFIMERLRAWYMEKGITPDVFAAVHARYPTSPLDFDKRINAVTYFQKLPEAQALASANKRVSNILKQANFPAHTNYNYALFELDAEKNLANLIEQKAKKIEALCMHYDYENALSILSQLREVIDQFFDQVMVMTEDEKLKNNRLILLNNLRQLFLQIADISLLQS